MNGIPLILQYYVSTTCALSVAYLFALGFRDEAVLLYGIVMYRVSAQS